MAILQALSAIAMYFVVCRCGDGEGFFAGCANIVEWLSGAGLTAIFVNPWHFIPILLILLVNGYVLMFGNGPINVNGYMAGILIVIGLSLLPRRRGCRSFMIP